MKKILVFGAHPDDVEFGCGGLLVKEIQNKTQVKIVVCSLGEASTNGTSEERKNESIAAASLIGAEIEFIELGGDAHMQNTPLNVFKIAGMIRDYKPNIVLSTSQAENQHPDHKALALITRSACRIARYGGVAELKDKTPHMIESLYYYPSNAEFSSKPDIIVDVSSVYDIWVNAMSLHKSQMMTRDYINLVESRAKAYGASIGVDYAIVLWANDPVRVDHISSLISSRHF